MRRLACGLAVGMFLWATAPAAAQQGTSSMIGKVTDQGGGVLPGVAVVLTNEDTGISRDVTTGAEGSFFASQVTPGRYRVSAKLEGFKSLERRNIVLEVGRTATVDLTLEVGGLAETVTVSTEAPLIDTTSAQVGGHITATELSELPAGNRSYMAFVGNVPGAQFVPTTGFLNDTMLANGQPAAANNVTVDGAGNIDDLRGSNVGGQARTANESLQEGQVMTNQFDAEFGRASGAVINAVTKSGSNQISGSAFQFYTGRKVTAKDFFARVNNQEKPEVGKTEWGGTVGGPIMKNRLFYFASFERITQKRNQSRDFPTRPEFSYSNTDNVGAWNTFFRVDHQLTKNNTWAFRWQREYAPQFNVLSGSKDTVQANGDETDLDQTFVGTLTSVVSNTMVNTVRGNYTKEQTVHSNPAWRALDPSYAKCVPCPDEVLNDQSKVAPQLSYLSLNIQSGTTMDYSLDNAPSIEDTLSWFIPDKAGRHDLKFGAKYSYAWISNPNNANANGTYTFNHDLVFNAADPRTYPERFTIRVPAALNYELISRTWEFYAQDKWQVKNGLTLSLGIRYDLEVAPINETSDPLIKSPSAYPVDKNNFAPRLGIIWNPDGKGKSVIRAGFGLFYDRTLLGTIDDYLINTKYARSFTATFPQNAADPGPGNGQFPTDPTLKTTSVTELTPAVRAYINSIYPPGSLARNTGTVTFDDPARKQPRFQQITAGYQRELFTGLSVSVDYVRMTGKDLFLSPNLNLGTRVNTTRTGAIVFTDPFGILNASLSPGEAPYVSPTVQLRTTKYGYSNYDALDLSVEKRFSHNYSARLAYSTGYSRGVTAGQGDTPQLQVGSNLNLDKYYAPANVDRKHNLTLSGRAEVPKMHGMNISGTMRFMSGTPFTIQDQNIDADQNTVFFDPLPAGTYDGTAVFRMHSVTTDGKRNGARGPNFLQADMRIGYRVKAGGKRTVDVFGEFFNITNHANFTNPSGNRMNAGDFLRLAGLVATSGLPRQGQLGLRLGF
jgi:hypothetical protein